MPPKPPSKAVSRAISVPAIMSPGELSPTDSGTARRPYASYDDAITAPSVSVRLGVKRVKLTVLALVAIGAVATSVLVFRGGVAIKHVALASSDEATRSKLVDQYNSYTGNISAALTKPIELFATMALQLVLLRFATRAVLQPERSWRLDMVSVTAAWVLLYLLLNGFNSLNVQIKLSNVVSQIDASDLSSTVAAARRANASANGTTATALARVTNATLVVPESTPGNLVANTVLRTAVLPRVGRLGKTACTRYGSSNAELIDNVDFGFQMRTWNAKLLPSALAPKQLTIPLTGNTTTANPSDLPMPVARAVRLFSLAVVEGDARFRWFENLNVGRPDTIEAARTTPGRSPSRPMLLPPSPSTEDADRDWFVRNLPAYVNAELALGSGVVPKNDTETGVTMRFSHVDISSRIRFDAVTIDAAVNLFKYTDASTNGNTTRLYDWGAIADTCGPSSVCMAMKELYGSQGAFLDEPSRVYAGLACSESDPNFKWTACNSTTSMVVVSVAKKLTADAVDATNQTMLRIVNASKIYSLTVGLLTWETEELAPMFGATCNVPGGCRGLQLPLTTGQTGDVADEVLVVSESALPVAELFRHDMTTLVLVREPFKRFSLPSSVDAPYITQNYDIPAGDALLPHNIGDGWVVPPVNTTCSRSVETRLHSMLINHMYMEDGLQPAYMAALFWLFQDGVAKAVRSDTLTASETSSTQQLAFDGNIQISALVASIPEANVWLSMAGCVLLTVGVLSTIVFSGHLGDTNAPPTTGLANASSAQKDVNTRGAMLGASDPRVIAQVMLDERRFPPMFLDRKLVDTRGGGTSRTMESLQISSMMLESEHADGSKTVMNANTNAGAGEP